MKTTGITLLILGLALTIFTATRFFTTEKVIDIGKVEITRQMPHDFSWPPMIGIVVIGIGGIVLLQNSKK